MALRIQIAKFKISPIPTESQFAKNLMLAKLSHYAIKCTRCLVGTTITHSEQVTHTNTHTLTHTHTHTSWASYPVVRTVWEVAQSVGGHRWHAGPVEGHCLHRTCHEWARGGQNVTEGRPVAGCWPRRTSWCCSDQKQGWQLPGWIHEHWEWSWYQPGEKERQ